MPSSSSSQLKLAPGGPDEPNGIPAFLSKAMTPPHQKSVMNALELLVELGAMDEETNELSDLGVCLSALSLEPRKHFSTSYDDLYCALPTCISFLTVQTQLVSVI